MSLGDTLRSNDGKGKKPISQYRLKSAHEQYTKLINKITFDIQNNLFRYKKTYDCVSIAPWFREIKVWESEGLDTKLIAWALDNDLKIVIEVETIVGPEPVKWIFHVYELDYYNERIEQTWKNWFLRLIGRPIDDNMIV